jgi:nucleoside-diphosphate-sugar epimerase
MKVFLTGATGVAGRTTVRALVRAGHDVRAVSRRPESDAVLEASGATPVTVDLFDADAVERAVVGTEAVVHLATNVPTLRRAGRPKGWDMHNRLRVEATRHLVAAARSVGAARFVKESISFVYADGGDEWLTERSPVLTDSDALAPTLEGERIAAGFAIDGGDAVVLRFGLFYGGDGNRGTGESLSLARLGRSMIAGRPDAFVSSIHCDDVAGAVVASLGAPAGVYNVVDDEPLRRRDYLAAFGESFGIRPPRPTPPAVVRVLGGKSAAAGLVASQRVRNGAFREATGWAPQFPSAREGWPQVAARWGQEAS